MGFVKEHENEVFTDNTQISYCEECANCANWGSDVYSNEYDKSSCDKYPFPEVKPDWVINNYGDCDYFTEKEE